MLPFNMFNIAKRKRIFGYVENYVNQLPGGRMEFTDWEGEEDDVLPFSVYADSDESLNQLKDAVAFMNSHAHERTFGSEIQISMERHDGYEGEGVCYSFFLVAMWTLDAHEVKEIFGRMGEILGTAKYFDGGGELNHENG